MAATFRISEPSALAVAALFLFSVTPLGSVEYVTVQAARVVPMYPANGIVIVMAAFALPSRVQGTDTASLPHTTLVALVPFVPGFRWGPWPPVAPVRDFDQVKVLVPTVVLLYLNVSVIVPSFVPQIALVFGMQRVFAQLGLYNNVPGVVVALLVFYVPYMTLLLSAVFENYDMDYEYQAASLGVSKWHVLWHVTLPQVRSGVIVTCIFSFIGVWSAYLVVAAVAPPSFKTMSLLMFPMITTAAGGYAATACGAILYIAPILAVLVIFSELLVNDDTRLDAGV